MCTNCHIKPIAPGKHKYCRECARMSGTTARRARRMRLKVKGIPTWQRNGRAWADSVEREAFVVEHRSELKKIITKIERQEARFS